jgi:hypothetical protein
MIELLAGISYAAEPGSPESISGNTASREPAEGRRWTWEVLLGGAPFAIWETLWSTGERELVFADRDVTSTTPVSVAKLMSRRRASIEGVRDMEYIAARKVLPDSDDWPRFSNCTESDMQYLVPPTAAEVLHRLGYIGHDTRAAVLEATGPNRNQLLALFRPGSRAANVGFYLLSRVAPTFRKAGLQT